MTDEIEQLYQNHADDPRPLPLIIASIWRFLLQHDEVAEWFAIQDWIAGITGVSPVKAGDIWRKMDADELRISIQQLPYRASNGKTYQLDYTDDKGLYTIAAHLRATKGRTALAAIKRYLARAGAFADAIRLNPDKAIEAGTDAYRRRGKDDDWIQERIDGKLTRHHFTDALREAVAATLSAKEYQQASNDVYLGLWKRTAAQLKEDLGLSKRQSLRDHQPALALAYQRIAEQVAAAQLGERQQVTWEEAREIVATVATLIGYQTRQTSGLLGVDLATGKPLLGKGDKSEGNR